MKTLDSFIKFKGSWEVEGVEWRKVKLSEITGNIKSGFALSKKKRRKIDNNNGIPQLRPYNIGNWNEINLDKLTYIPKSMTGIEKYFVKNNDVLFNNTNSIELVGRAIVYKGSDGKYTYSNHITRIRVKDQIIIPNFLSWYLTYLWNKGYFYLRATKWIGQAGVSIKKLVSTKILLPFRNGKPDLETQKKIVEYIEVNFSRIDRILEKKKKEIELLDELWENVLEQAFKPKAEEAWGKVRFLDKINLVKGAKPKNILQQKQENSLPYLTVEYFRSKEIKEFILIEKEDKSRITIVQDGDLVVIVDGSRSGEIFFCDTKGVLVSTMAKFEFDKEEIETKYLYGFLITLFEHLNKSKYTATPHINKKYLKDLKIPLPFRNGKPDLEKQKEIVNRLDNIYEKVRILKKKIQNQIDLLEEMKKSILDEVFNHGN